MRVHAFDVLGDPVRRRILELLTEPRPDSWQPAGSLTAGEITWVIRAETGISQPAVSQHLKVLRDNGFATVTPQGRQRLYAVTEEPLVEVETWLERYRGFWQTRLDAMELELRRGRAQQARTASERHTTTGGSPNTHGGSDD